MKNCPTNFIIFKSFSCSVLLIVFNTYQFTLQFYDYLCTRSVKADSGDDKGTIPILSISQQVRSLSPVSEASLWSIPFHNWKTPGRLIRVQYYQIRSKTQPALNTGKFTNCLLSAALTQTEISGCVYGQNYRHNHIQQLYLGNILVIVWRENGFEIATCCRWWGENR